MNRSNLAEMEDLFYDLSSFAVDDPALEGMGLVDTIKLVKPNILIGEFYNQHNCMSCNLISQMFQVCSAANGIVQVSKLIETKKNCHIRILINFKETVYGIERSTNRIFLQQ